MPVGRKKSTAARKPCQESAITTFTLDTSPLMPVLWKRDGSAGSEARVRTLVGHVLIIEL